VEIGRVVILNGPPRSGKSSIVAVIQDTFDGVWMNLGVDVFVQQITPKKARPGMGLRPGEPDHPVAPLVPTLYAALYDSIAAHARAGLNVIVDVGHHDQAILADCARRLIGIPVLFVGVSCSVDALMRRRELTWQQGEDVRPYVERWQAAMPRGVYDVEVDTSHLSPEQCAQVIRERLAATSTGDSAFERLAASG
jgi:chloramphenicol 3-O phosphotransferase